MAENLQNKNTEVADEKLQAVTGGTKDYNETASAFTCPYCGANIDIVLSTNQINVTCPLCGKSFAAGENSSRILVDPMPNDGSTRFG